MIIDEDGPWTAAAYLVDDPAFAGMQHGMGDSGTLCGIAESDIAVVRNPFWGTQPKDCVDCVLHLRRLAAECPVCGAPELTRPPYKRWPPPPRMALEPPYERQLGQPSYEVCPNCGFEFGNDDNPGTAAPVTFAEYRAEWESEGSHRFDQSSAPPAARERPPAVSALSASELSDLPGQWWTVIGTPDAVELESELGRELPEGHVLRGIRVEAIAVRKRLKDVVYWLPESERWAWVHLTYAVETDPRWPSAVVAATWAEMIEDMR